MMVNRNLHKYALLSVSLLFVCASFNVRAMDNGSTVVTNKSGDKGDRILVFDSNDYKESVDATNGTIADADIDNLNSGNVDNDVDAEEQDFIESEFVNLNEDKENTTVAKQEEVNTDFAVDVNQGSCDVLTGDKEDEIYMQGAEEYTEALACLLEYQNKTMWQRFKEYITRNKSLPTHWEEMFSKWIAATKDEINRSIIEQLRDALVDGDMTRADELGVALDNRAVELEKELKLAKLGSVANTNVMAKLIIVYAEKDKISKAKEEFTITETMQKIRNRLNTIEHDSNGLVNHRGRSGQKSQYTASELKNAFDDTVNEIRKVEKEVFGTVSLIDSAFAKVCFALKSLGDLAGNELPASAYGHSENETEGSISAITDIDAE